MQVYKINLYDTENIKKYINIVDKFPSLNITLKSGHREVDGKSQIGLFTLDLRNPIEVGVIGTDEVEIQEFDYRIKELLTN